MGTRQEKTVCMDNKLTTSCNINALDAAGTKSTTNSRRVKQKGLPSSLAATAGAPASLQLKHKPHSTCLPRRLNPQAPTALPCQGVGAPHCIQLLLPHALH